jgi:hypothetical protein
MSTRSYIIVKSGDQFTGQYCHSDGYPSHVGKMLKEHYSTQAKAEHLSSLGHLSSLHEHPDPLPEAPNSRSWDPAKARILTADQHSFDTPQEGVTVAYGRDRREDEQEADNVTHGSLPDMDQEYEYLWDGQEWKYREVLSVARHEIMDPRLPWLPL